MSPETCPDELWKDDVGIPIGNLTSQLFANVYLNELDQYCKHELKTHYYIRYMDDMIILSDDKRHLAALKSDIEEFLNVRLRLDLNDKTAIRPISLGVDFVGHRIWGTHKKLRKQTARRIIRRVKFLVREVRDGRVAMEAFRRTAASYGGILDHCDSYGLRRRLNQVYLRIMREGGK
jgi:hypothetical protein